MINTCRSIILSGGGSALAEILTRTRLGQGIVINFSLHTPRLVLESHLRTVSSEIIVGSGRDLLVLTGAGTEAGGVGHPHHTSHVGCAQPALLVVVSARELPAYILTRGKTLVVLSPCPQL